jgi:hypothetical protein
MQLIRQLGSDEFREREAAGNALRALGRQALPALHKAAAGDGDLEVRFRARALVAELDGPVLAFRRLGGTVDVDEKAPAQPVVGVDLSNTRATDDVLIQLKGLTALRELRLPGNVRDAGLEHLKSLAGLERLYCRSARVTDRGLAHLEGLKKLRYLHLDCPKVTDAGLAHLKGLVKLVTLYVDSPGVTDAGLAHLRGLTDLRVLSLFGTGVTDKGLIHLKGLRQLRIIDLDRRKVTARGLADLRESLPHLSRE